MAIKSFRTVATRDIAAGINSKDARRIPQRVWTAAQRRLDDLDAATSLADLRLPGLHLEPLKHTKPGYFSIRVNDQYRLLFRFDQGSAYDVEIADYHGGR
jgi:proteic killer suppression protein